MENSSLLSLKSVPIVTNAGRETSARNAIKHGACAVKTLILESESHDDYLALEARWFRGYNVNPAKPGANEIEVELIRNAARAEWFFLRAERNHAEAEAAMTNEAPNVLTWGNDHHFVLSRFLRYRTANANLLAKARKEIAEFRKVQAQQLAQQQKADRGTVSLALAKHKLRVYQAKHHLPDIEEIPLVTESGDDPVDLPPPA